MKSYTVKIRKNINFGEMARSIFFRACRGK